MSKLRSIKRVLVLPLNYDHPQKGMVDAFRWVFGAQNVQVFDYLEKQRLGWSNATINSEFVADVAAWRPDWVFMQLQETGVITGAAIAQARAAHPAIFTHWTGDYRPVITPYLASICQACDMTFVSSKGQLGDFYKAGASDVSYCQIGLDWDEDVLGLPAWVPPFKVPDVVFLGNHYEAGPWPQGSAERLAAVKALSDAPDIDFGVVGAGWPSWVPVVGTCTVKQQHHVWTRAKVAINVNHANDVANYYSDRLLIAMASGTPVVTRYVPGLEEEFEQCEDLFWFNGDDNLLRHVRALLTEPALQACMGARGRHTVMRDHSWYARVMDLLPIVEGWAP